MPLTGEIEEQYGPEKGADVAIWRPDRVDFCPHCGGALDARRAEPSVDAPNQIAHATGFLDGCAGRLDDSRWPAGTYGHADYHLGHREGELHRIKGEAIAA